MTIIQSSVCMHSIISLDSNHEIASRYYYSHSFSMDEELRRKRLRDLPKSAQSGGTVVRICLQMEERPQTWVRSRGLEDPLEKEMATHSSILA